MKRILAAIDFSPITRRVIAESGDLARAGNARLILLNVTTPESLVRDCAALESTLESTALRKHARSAHHRGLQGDTLQIVGEPVAVILEQAARYSVDFIVLRSHGHSALFDLLVGGTAAGVIRGAHCPVMVIPPLRRGREKSRGEGHRHRGAKIVARRAIPVSRRSVRKSSRDQLAQTKPK